MSEKVPVTPDPAPVPVMPCSCQLVTGGNLIEDPLCVVHGHVRRRLERHILADKVDAALDRPAPFLGGMTPREWVRSGHSWDEYATKLDSGLNRAAWGIS